MQCCYTQLKVSINSECCYVACFSPICFFSQFQVFRYVGCVLFSFYPQLFSEATGSPEAVTYNHALLSHHHHCELQCLVQQHYWCFERFAAGEKYSKGCRSSDLQNTDLKICWFVQNGFFYGSIWTCLSFLLLLLLLQSYWPLILWVFLEDWKLHSGKQKWWSFISAVYHFKCKQSCSKGVLAALFRDFCEAVTTVTRLSRAAWQLAATLLVLILNFFRSISCPKLTVHLEVKRERYLLYLHNWKHLHLCMS